MDGLFSSVDYLAALRDGRLEEMEQQTSGKNCGGLSAADRWLWIVLSLPSDWVPKMFI